MSKTVRIILLLISVLIIWGVISIQIYRATHSTAFVLKTSVLSSESHQDDTSEFSFSYRDPFFETPPTYSSDFLRFEKKKTQSGETTTLSVDDTPSIEFKGSIANLVTKLNRTGIFEWNGSVVIASTGDQIGPCTVTRISADTAFIECNEKKIKLIRK